MSSHGDRVPVDAQLNASLILSSRMFPLDYSILLCQK